MLLKLLKGAFSLVLMNLLVIRYVWAQDISVFTLSTDLIDLNNIFAGETISRIFKISLDPGINNKVLNYKIVRPDNVFCQSILFKPEEQEDAINSAFLRSSTDREDIWELLINVPELENRTLLENSSRITVGNYECNIQVQALSLQDETTQPPPSGDGGTTTPPTPSTQPSASGGGGFLAVSQQIQQKGQISEVTPLLPTVSVPKPSSSEDLYLINESFRIKEIGADYIIIMFNTSLPSFIKIVYDQSSHDPVELDKKNYGYASSTEETVNMGSFFEIKLVGLNPDTAYYFRVVMRNPNFTKLSKEFYVKTLAIIKTTKEIKEPSVATTTPTATSTYKEKERLSLLKLFTLASLWNLFKNLPVELWLIIILVLILIINYLRRKFKEQKLRKLNLFTKLRKYFMVWLLLFQKKAKKDKRK